MWGNIYCGVMEMMFRLVEPLFEIDVDSGRVKKKLFL
jgi:hypothetical protein